MKMDPLAAAAEIFGESTRSMMAHTIRGTVNHFRRQHLELDIKVFPDTYGTILKTNGHSSPASILRTGFHAGAQAPMRGRVTADIAIHKDANHHLARICIAHEIYHLLCELENWKAAGGVGWENIPLSPDLEDACNQFAWQLCLHHDGFNRDEPNRQRHILFPDKLFERPFTTDTLKQGNWPLGIGLDSKNPFFKRR
jgi:hypothetical protein